MTLLTWSHACTVGVKAMDDQHGILMDTMNELRLTLVRGSGHQQIDAQLEQLIEFTRKHFECEEHLLEQHAFPGLQEHRAAHERLLGQIHETVSHAEQRDELEIQPLLFFLRTWYLEHIEHLDRQYGPWLNSRGVY
jgi:hemerythrin-like metal-binding protein